jgi:hypothetical protein
MGKAETPKLKYENPGVLRAAPDGVVRRIPDHVESPIYVGDVCRNSPGSSSNISAAPGPFFQNKSSVMISSFQRGPKERAYYLSFAYLAFLICVLNFVRVIQSRMMKWKGHLKRMCTKFSPVYL